MKPNSSQSNPAQLQSTQPNRTITTQYNPTLSHLIQLQLNQAKYNLTQLNQA